MNLRKLLPLVLLFVSFSFYAQSQSMKEKKEQIKYFKSCFFFTTELDLTTILKPKKFWPLFTMHL
jgi:hypothetical protein